MKAAKPTPRELFCGFGEWGRESEARGLLYALGLVMGEGYGARGIVWAYY